MAKLTVDEKRDILWSYIRNMDEPAIDEMLREYVDISDWPDEQGEEAEPITQATTP